MFKTILLVDDDNDDTELFVEALQEIDSHITCIVATNGKEAIDKLEQASAARPDIIFLDINMPGMNGWQCLTQVKEHPGNSQIPVIIYSTSNARRDRDQAARLGAIGLLTKPADYQELKSVLRLLLSQPGEQELRHSIRHLTG